MPIGLFKSRPPARIALALACIAFPASIYAVAFYLIGGTWFFPEDVSPEALGLAFAARSAALFAEELAAREAFFIASVAMTLACTVALAYALALILRDRTPGAAIFTALAAAATGGLAVLTQGNTMRTVVFETPMLRAAAESATFGAAGFLRGAEIYVSVNTFIGLAAVAALIGRFFHLTLGNDGETRDAAGLARRAAALRESVTVASLVLTSATVATYFYYHYPLSLMTDASRAIYGPIAGIASLRWGVAYTVVLATTVAPAFAAHLEDRRVAVAEGAAPADAAKTGWLSKDAIGANLKALGAVATILAPAVAAPLLDLIEALTAAG